MDKDCPKPTRLRLLIDREVQGALLIRTVLYSLSGTLYMGCVLFFSQALSSSQQSWWQHLAAFSLDMLYWGPGLVVLLPLLAHDLLRVSNRFAGPIYRLRTEMQRLVDGREAGHVKFRDSDYCNDLATLYNQLREELLEHRAEALKRSEGPTPLPESTELFQAKPPAELEEDDWEVVTSGEAPPAKPTEDVRKAQLQEEVA